MGYLKDNKGNKSMTRLLVFLACLTALLISIGLFIAVVYFESITTAENPKELEYLPIVEVITALLAYAGFKKVFQKREEMQK